MPEERPVENDRLARRRASLLVALRDGDLRSAARAWSRLRLRGAAITAAESAAGRAARGEVGRALRTARERRSAIDATPDRPSTAIPLPAGAPRWRRAAAIGLALVGIAAALLPLVPRIASVDVRTPATPLTVATAAVGGRIGGGRGRTEAGVPFVPAVTTAPTSSPTVSVAAPASSSIAPTAPPLPSPTPSVSPTPTPHPSPAPIAVPSAAPVPASTPAASLLPPPLASGFSRIRVLVVDATTLAPIAGACIVIGTPDCAPSRPHTNALGLWWVDFPTGSIAGVQFPVTIQKDGYQPLSVVVTTSGSDQDFPAPLTPSR